MVVATRRQHHHARPERVTDNPAAEATSSVGARPETKPGAPLQPRVSKGRTAALTHGSHLDTHFPAVLHVGLVLGRGLVHAGVGRIMHEQARRQHLLSARSVDYHRPLTSRLNDCRAALPHTCDLQRSFR